MANRFFNLQPTQYVDPYVAPPVEMLYNMLQQKQAGYDTSLTNLDSTGSLIGRDRVHEVYQDMYNKEAQVFQNKINEITDNLIKDKNTSQAARELFKTKQALERSHILKNAPAESKKIWETEDKIRDNKETVSDWNMFYNQYWNNYSKNILNPDGTIRAFNPGQLYEKDLNLSSFAKSLIGDVKASGYKIGNDKIDEKSGLIIDTKTGRESITSKQIRKLSNIKAIDFLRSPEGKQFNRMLEKTKYGRELSGEELFTEASNFLYRTGANQIFSKTEDSTNLSTLSGDWLDRFSNPTGGQWMDYTNLNQEMFNDKLTDLRTNFNYSILSENIPNTIPGLKLGAKIFEVGLNSFNENDFVNYNNLKSSQKNLLNLFMENNKNKFFVTPASHSDTKKYNANEVFENYKNGKATLTEKALIQDYFSDFINKELSPNLSKNTKVKGLPLQQQKQIGTNLGITLGDRGEFSPQQLAAGPLKNLEVYDQQENKFVKFADIKFGSEDKAVINLEFSHNSPFFFMSGNKSEFANPRQLSIRTKDGEIKNFVIPKLEGSSNEKYTDEVVGKISLADNMPGKFVPTHNPNYKVKLTTKESVSPNPYMPEGLTYDTGMEQQMLNTGLDLNKSYDVYDKKGNKLNTMILSTPIQAAAFIDNFKTK
jgi:hypothetical protein